jgi:hypothetical protein
MRLSLCLSFLALSISSTCSLAQAPSSATSAIQVLFVGNSLTYTNDLPGTLEGIALQGGRPVSCASVTRPGYALIDHLDGGSDAVDVIRRGGWDYVVLQQGPSSLPESRVILIDGTERFDVEIRAIGAMTSLYMVWPDLSRYAYFEAVRQNYKAAADTVGGLFLPGGEAWLKAWEDDPSLALYGPDNFHPSPLGTYLVALVMYERITGGDARELPSTAVVAGSALNVPVETVQLLQSAAHATNARYVTTSVGYPQLETGVPEAYQLDQNYPNPFNPTTHLRYGLPGAAMVTVSVYNIFGQMVATLVDEAQSAGYHDVVFDGGGLASGLYFYRLQAGSFVDSKKLMLLK